MTSVLGMEPTTMFSSPSTMALPVEFAEVTAPPSPSVREPADTLAAVAASADAAPAASDPEPEDAKTLGRSAAEATPVRPAAASPEAAATAARRRRIGEWAGRAR